ncbi:hypothetical protein EV138_6456 [Kribbella voronezhensis]|uniref:Uncharacterized protein n=1 Tax=Kribbella voronezhensis TaxID=2512212 RepID=A0A4R7SXJ0_9ACTN|nr:hypothetical protein [Kribbella voronezhensis]TDU83991.1 hypothetical protein EV138_6456 [Kribbella voronezhensis]
MHHHLALTTHTAELRQIHEINAALASGHRVTAGSAGVPKPVPEFAVLRYLEATGPPSYPYVYGHFSQPGTDDTMRAKLHTPQLRAISHQLSLRSHIWGIGSGSVQPFGRSSADQPLEPR